MTFLIPLTRHPRFVECRASGRFAAGNQGEPALTEFAKFALLGLGLGGIYALAAQGIVLVYRGSGVLNFAHGAMAAVGAYAYVEALDAGVSHDGSRSSSASWPPRSSAR